jgi:hypothetical protein
LSDIVDRYALLLAGARLGHFSSKKNSKPLQ